MSVDSLLLLSKQVASHVQSREQIKIVNENWRANNAMINNAKEKESTMRAIFGVRCRFLGWG